MPGPIVGREPELAQIADFLDGCAAGPSALVIEGEAGAGKTTLWLAGVAGAGERSFRVLSSRPVEAETKLSFSGLGDLLEHALDEACSSLPLPQRQALAVALLREEAEGRPPEQRAVAVACLNALRRLAEGGPPVLIAIDDVQWLDPATAAVVEFVVRRLRDEPIGVLLASRIEGPVRPPLGLDRALPEQRLSRVRAGPLSLGALHQMLSARLGASFARPVMRRVHQASGGNPFFALELARALQRRGGRLDSGQELPVPEELRSLVVDRLATLDPETREALLVAAALSQPTVQVVAAAIADDAEARLGPAAREHVVVLEGGRIRFEHPLLASATYSGADAARRRDVHRRLAAVVTDPEERAGHLGLATEEPDEDVAAALEEAARAAFSRGAPQAAVDLCDQALRLTPPDRLESLRRRRLAQADYCFRTGESARAGELIEAVLAASPPGPLRAEALSSLGYVEFFGLDWRAAAETYAAALAERGADDVVRARSELGLANALLLLREDIAAAAEHARAAVALAERIQDTGFLALTLGVQAESEFLLGVARFPVELMERALSLETAVQPLAVALQPRIFFALVLSWADDVEASLAHYELVRQKAVEFGDETSLGWALARVSLVECLAGSFQDAVRHLEEAHDIVLLSRQDANRAVVLATRALVEAHLGRTAAARVSGEEALRIAADTRAKLAERIARSALGFLALSLGEPSQAHAHLEALFEDTRAAGIREPGEFRFLPDWIEALIDLGRLAEAEAALAFLEDCAHATNRISGLAAAGRCRGLLAGARGDLEGGLGSFAAAVRLHERVSMPFERARTLLALGESQRRARQKREARETLGQALAEFERLGAALWADKARAELARIGGRRASGSELTPTEQRVAALVAEGLTNREVATRLFLTQKTVEFHLRNVYRKLGVRSRTELTRALAGKA